MNNKSAIGMMTFAGLSILLGLGLQILLERIGLDSTIGHAGAYYLCGCPIALVAARRVGHVTRLPLLTTSLGVLCLELAALVYVLNMVAEPAGGHAGWPVLFNATNWRATVGSGLAALILPQLWLSVLDTWSGGPASKAPPVRDSA